MDARPSAAAADASWLALDTSGDQISIYLGPGPTAVSGQGQVSWLPAASLPSERLVARLAEMLAEGACAPRDLAGLVVGLGPGSFTGLRVGLATAKGLCMGAGVPIYGISSLALLAASAAAASAPSVTAAAAAATCAPDWFVAARDARRGALYIGVYEVDGEGVAHPVLPDQILTLDAAVAWLKSRAGGHRLHLSGDAAEALAGASSGASLCVSQPPEEASARFAWAQAKSAAAAGQADDLFALVPRYLRVSAAEHHLQAQS